MKSISNKTFFPVESAMRRRSGGIRQATARSKRGGKKSRNAALVEMEESVAYLTIQFFCRECSVSTWRVSLKLICGFDSALPHLIHYD